VEAWVVETKADTVLSTLPAANVNPPDLSLFVHVHTVKTIWLFVTSEGERMLSEGIIRLVYLHTIPNGLEAPLKVGP